MAEDQRRSKREVKIRRDSAYEYDEKVLSALTRNYSSEGDSWYQCDNSASNCVKSNTNTELVNADSVTNTSVVNSWSQVVFNSNSNVNSAEYSPVFSDNFVNTSHTKSLLLQSASVTATVFGPKVNSQCVGGRRSSSTTTAFLDLPGNFFSATSLASMGISDSEPEVNNKSYSVNKTGGAAGFSGNSAFTPESPLPADDGLTAAILAMCQDMRVLSAKVDSMSDRLENLEARNSAESGVESSNRLSSHGVEQSVKQKVSVGSKSTTKMGRVEFEKGRTEKVVLEKLKDRKKEQTKSESEVSSEEEQDSQGVKKKLSRKKRDEARRRAAAVLKKAGATFPEEEDISSNNSGTESEVYFNPRQSKKSKRSVKSGAKVRCRPVVKTELWPHTIANEDDGDNSTSDNISLAKFLACYTYIMISCEESEASGRALLLHAVCSVLEYLPWADTRAFHNLIMTKVEQDRISWDDDFTDLAKEFIDKKVRQSLRVKSQPAGATSGSRNNFRPFGKGFGYPQRSPYGQGGNNNPNSTYTVVCKNWNQGTCAYGDRCRRRHVCWTCHENGKTEHHKSTTHGASSGARTT